jgi:predicted kinase
MRAISLTSCIRVSDAAVSCYAAPMNRIVLVTGPPGAGKSTVARALAETSASAMAVHLHTDDFYAYIRKGFVPPWNVESHAQNRIVMDALVASAAVFARGAYEVFVDGIVGPWFLEPWRALAREQTLDVRYVALIPAEEETVARATARTDPLAMTDPAVVRAVYAAFLRSPPPPGNVLDTSGESVEATVSRVRAALATDALSLP